MKFSNGRKKEGRREGQMQWSDGSREQRGGRYPVTKSWHYFELSHEHVGEIRMWKEWRTRPSFQAGVPGEMEVQLCRTQLTGEESGLDRRQ